MSQDEELSAFPTDTTLDLQSLELFRCGWAPLGTLLGWEAPRGMPPCPPGMAGHGEGKGAKTEGATTINVSVDPQPPEISLQTLPTAIKEIISSQMCSSPHCHHRSAQTRLDRISWEQRWEWSSQGRRCIPLLQLLLLRYFPNTHGIVTIEFSPQC